MELEVGMYCRTKNGSIDKINRIIDNPLEKIVFFKGIVSLYPIVGNTGQYIDEEVKNIIKASHNIIDLIEVEDIVLVDDIKYQVIKVTKNLIYTTKCPFEIEEIDYIVTKEQFESVSYKLGKEDN